MESEIHSRYGEILCCPACGADLKQVRDAFVCKGRKCRKSYPIDSGVPVLIDDSRSIFSVEDIVRETADAEQRSAAKRAIARMLPRPTINLVSEGNYRKFAELLLGRSRNPRVLVLGGRVLGSGMGPLAGNSGIELIETDVSHGPRTSIIADAHDIPFKDRSVDGVVIQAVLEHVTDPSRCVEEMYRVLKKGGLVYAETPFMQQVHGGRYDFTRFSHMGHSMLFRGFEEISSGPVIGPAGALSWSLSYFLSSFFRTGKSRALASILARVSTFWVKYLDHYLLDRPGAYNASSSYYFMGRKTGAARSDREILKGFSGFE